MSEISESIKINCIERWGKEDNDERIKRFESVYKEWLETIKDENRDLIYNLLGNFEYYGHQYINRGLKDLHIRLLKKYSIDDNETFYTHIEKSDSSLSSSHHYAQEYIFLNNISMMNYLNNIHKVYEYDENYVKNIVIIDDYSGTGESIIKFLSNYIRVFLNKKIFIVLISISEYAKCNIINFAKRKKLKIIIESITSEEKAFCKLDLSDEEIVEKKREFELISNEKEIINFDDIWGRNDAEALVAFYNNTPNDTLGIFWKQTDKNNPLFPRRQNKKPEWRKMRLDKRKREYENSQNFKGEVDG